MSLLLLLRSKAAAAGQNLTRTATDTVTTSETVVRLVAAARTATDSTSVTDAPSRRVAATRTVTDTTSVTDSIATVVVRNFLRLVSESTSVTENLVRTLHAARAPPENLTTADTLVRVLAAQRGPTDTTSVTDSITSTRRNPTQFLRPVSDVAGNWHAEDERTTNLYASVDDSPFDDDTFIESPDNPTATDYAELNLPSAADPATGAGHIVRYRYGGSGTTTLVVELRQGTTVIASWTHIDPGAPTLAEQTLTEVEADAITDYSDLRIRVRAA